MKRVLAIATLVLALLPASAVAKCRFACLSHKVTDLKALSFELRERIEDDEERISQLVGFTVFYRTRSNSLEAANAQLATRLDNFQRCLGEVPVSRYGEEQGPAGYVFQYQGPLGLGSLPTTALDVTYGRDPVGAWIWANTCNRERITPQTSLLKGGRDQ